MRTVAIVLLCVCSFQGCSKKEEGKILQSASVDHEELRAMNVAAYEAAREGLLRTSHDQWAVIARGKVHAPFPDFAQALEIADEVAPGDSHRFIWRPGKDDEDWPFDLSIWKDEPGRRGNWMQVGHGLPRLLGIEEAIGAAEPESQVVRWTLNGKEKSWPMPDVSRVTLTLQSPCGPDAEEANFIRSMTFVHNLTITPDVASRLHVERAAVPGSAIPKGGNAKWRLALVRVKEPALEIDELVVAFLVPTDLWEQVGR